MCIVIISYVDVHVRDITVDSRTRPSSGARPNLTDGQATPNPFPAEATGEKSRPHGAVPVDDAKTRRELLNSVDARLLQWRIRRGMTQSAVAAVSDLDQSSVSNYES